MFAQVTKLAISVTCSDICCYIVWTGDSVLICTLLLQVLLFELEGIIFLSHSKCCYCLDLVTFVSFAYEYRKSCHSLKVKSHETTQYLLL